MNAEDRPERPVDPAQITPPPPPVAPFRAAVGAGVRKLREQIGRSQDDVARVARALGLSWDRAKVAALERGQKSISAEELVLLLAVFRLLMPHGPHASVGTLLDGQREHVAFNDSFPAMWPPSIQALLSGDPSDEVTKHLDLAYEMGASSLMLDEGSAEIQRARRLGLLGVSNDAFAVADRGAGEAEEKAARKLAEPQFIIVAASAKLWGRALTEERDDRVRYALEEAGGETEVGEGWIRAKRGHVTRELVADIEDLLKSAPLSNYADAPPFSPANEVERALRSAILADDTERAWVDLLPVEVIVLLKKATKKADVYSRRFPWSVMVIDGQPHVTVFTSPERLRDIAQRLADLGLAFKDGVADVARFESARYPRVVFYDLVRAWPHEGLSLAINAGSGIGISVSSEAVEAATSVILEQEAGREVQRSLLDRVQKGIRWLPPDVPIAKPA